MTPLGMNVVPDRSLKSRIGHMISILAAALFFCAGIAARAADYVVSHYDATFQIKTTSLDVRTVLDLTYKQNGSFRI
jgi:hypothetical protein